MKRVTSKHKQSKQDTYAKVVWFEYLQMMKVIVANVAVAAAVISIISLSQQALNLSDFPHSGAILTSFTSVFRKVVLVIVAVSTLISIFIFFIRLWIRASSQVKQLKLGLRDAFIGRLDESSLNPARLIGERHV